MRELSLYLHIPFCVKKCDYCDFLSAPASLEVQEQYLRALYSEIRAKADDFSGYMVKTVFIGGGTPSILKPEQLCDLLKCVKESFRILPQAEITMEMNPGTGGGKEAFEQYKKAGINRLSIGLQSAKDEELKVLGRIHNFSQFGTTYREAREAGFTNLNIDIMSALPGQSVESYRETMETVCALRPEHISAYSLIIEEGTPFFSRYASETWTEENEECDRLMYTLTKQLLEDYGYHRYEISNYALSGRECRHNLVYWTGGEYLGLGLGASSFIKNTRYKNTSDLNTYLERKGNALREDIQVLTISDRMEEFMFLGLRLTEGVRKAEFFHLFGRTMDDVYGEVLRKNQNDGLLVSTPQRVFLTPRGVDLSNYVLAQFLF